MEEIGPSPGLPALSALLQVATMEEPSLRDRSAATDTALGLLADVAALPMRSPAPSSPTDLFFLDAGPPRLVNSAPAGVLMDVSMDSLYEAFDDVDAEPLPELLDVAWGSSEAAVPEPVPSSGAPVSPASVVTSPSAPSPPPSETLPVASPVVAPPAATAVSPPRDPVVGEEEAKSDADPYDADALLAAAESVMERPELPDPPERHPSARWWNHFNPDASVNPTRVYPLKKLIDRWGTPPHVAYLVEWDVKPCQLSWEWPENLRGVDYLMNQVNRWKSSGDPRDFNAYYRNYFRGATASETGMCFLESVQAACFDLGHPNLVDSCHWMNFCVEYGRDLSNGVVRADIVAFFAFLRRQRVGLDYEALFQNRLDVSVTDVKLLGRYAQSLHPGHYIVHAAHDLVEHCFSLVVNEREPGKLLKTIEVLDGYSTDYDPPCYREKLLTLEWLSKVISVYRLVIKPYPVKKKRKTKTEKKREARRRLK